MEVYLLRIKEFSIQAVFFHVASSEKKLNGFH